MTKYNVKIQIEITPENLAKIFWEMSDTDQAEFFNYLGKNVSLEEFKIQLYYVKNNVLSENAKEIMNAFANE